MNHTIIPTFASAIYDALAALALLSAILAVCIGMGA